MSNLCSQSGFIEPRNDTCSTLEQPKNGIVAMLKSQLYKFAKQLEQSPQISCTEDLADQRHLGRQQCT